ncbi:MAG: murein biosynthesis integral membrane protein MurJ [Actinobacteria bacterium]|nr:murein biosynthesis integral membrane protein MurJ [Actinomycetota bacterium]
MTRTEDADDRWQDASLAEDLAFEEAGVADDVIVDRHESSATDDHRGRSLLRASALPAVGTTLSRATGLIRVGALTYALGLTAIADVYNLANTTPNILYELVLGGVLSSTLVPLFVRTLDDPDDDTASVVTTVAFSAIVAMTLLGVLLAPWINRLFALPLSGAERAQQLELGDDFLELLIPQILFYGVTTLITALLHARRRFAPPAFTPVLTNLVTAAAAIGAAKWFARGGTHTGQVYLLGLGTTAGVAAMAIALVPFLRRSGISLRWRFQPRHPAVRSVLRLSGWTVGFAAANQVALMVILTLARAQEAGTVSAYQYAFILFQLPHGLIAVSLMTAILPELAEAAVDRDDRAYIARFREGMSLLLTFLLPAAVGLAFIAEPLIDIFLQRGSFNAQDTARTTQMLLGFAIGLPAFSIYLYCVRAFFARRDTRTPFFLNVVQNGLNVALVIPFTALWGARGLPLAYSASYWFIAIVTLYVLNRRVSQLLTVRAVLPLLRSAGVGAAVLFALAATTIVLGDQVGAVVRLVVDVGVAVLVFVPVTFMLKPKGFEPAIDRLRQGMRRRGRSMAG